MNDNSNSPMPRPQTKQLIKSWRREEHKYSALEMKVDDKNVCANCGHLGKTQSHTKSGCGSCGTHRGCDSSRWKEERLSLKSELALRKKALVDPNFPSQEIIDEFLNEPKSIPKLDLTWKQPNVVKFIKQIGHLLQWQEIYCFQKFFPLLTRWQVRFIKHQPSGSVAYVTPEEIVKKRTVKGVASLEIRWKDQNGFFNGLIPDEQLEIFAADNLKGMQDLWSSVEPQNLMEESYPELVKEFLASKEKPKKVKKSRNLKAKSTESTGSLNDLSALLEATNEIAKTVKPRKAPAKSKPKKGLQMIDKFLIPKKNPTQTSSFNPSGQCSTPKTKCIPSDIESGCEDDFDMSNIISGMIKNSAPTVTKHAGRLLCYEAVKWERSVDDLDLIMESKKRNLSSVLDKTAKRMSLDDSLDLLIAGKGNANYLQSPLSHVDRFLNKNYSLGRSTPKRCCLIKEEASANTSNFFGANPMDAVDEFEKSMDISFLKKSRGKDLILISDSSYSDE